MASTEKYDLDQYKTDEQRQIEQKRRDTQQAADINHKKLLKYLPQQTKGFSIGMTETAKIAANNAYQRQLAQAESDYNADMTELNNYVRTEQERLDDKAKAEQDALFSEAKGIIEGGVWNTGAELTNYVNSLEGRVSADQYGVLQQYASSIANNREQKSAEIEQAKTYNEDGTKNIEAKTSTKANVGGALTDTREGNNFKVGGYNVELGERADFNTVPVHVYSKVADKQVFSYNGDLFIRIGNLCYSVRGRGNKYDTDDYKSALALFA